MSVSTEERGVEHDDYDDRRRANCNDDRKTALVVYSADSVRIAG